MGNEKIKFENEHQDLAADILKYVMSRLGTKVSIEEFLKIHMAIKIVDDALTQQLNSMGYGVKVEK